MKVIVNAQRGDGGYGVSLDGMKWLVKKGYKVHECDIERMKKGENTYVSPSRTDPLVIQMVEELGGEKAGGEYAYLEVIEIPDDVEWCIEEYDEREQIAEQHRTWRPKYGRY